MDLKINPMFRDKIPPLTEDEFQRLEENIVADGEVLEPLIVWNKTIVDGHNRWRIIQKHPGIPYHIKEMDFADEYAVLYWICLHQIGRRNVTDEQKTLILAEAYEARKLTKGGQEGNSNAEKRMDHSGPFVSEDGGTFEKVAKEFGVGRTTVKRAKHFLDGVNAAEEVSPGFKHDVISGAVKAPKSIIAEIRNVPDDKKGEVVEAIKTGTKDGLKTAKDIIASAISNPSGKQGTQGRKPLELIVGGPVPEEHVKYSYAPADEASFVNDMENQLQGIVGSTVVKLNYFVMDGDVCKKMSQEYKNIIFEQGKQIISQLNTIFSYLGKEEST